MFEHLRMCIIHQIVPTQFNRQFLQKNIFAQILRVCKFSAGGWDDVICETHRSAVGGWVGMYGGANRGTGRPATQPLIY